MILCESLIDALTFWCAGYRNVTASYGVGGFTDDYREAFRKHGVKRVLIAYDRDEAGDNAAAALAEELMAVGIECFRVVFPKGMDANEYALKVGPAAKSLGVLINSAQWLGIGQAPKVAAIVEEKPAAKEETVAAPVPSLAASSLAAAVNGDEVIVTLADRRYRVRKIGKNTSSGTIKVNVMAACGDRVHIDTVNLEVAQQRAAFARMAAVELGVKDDAIRHDLGAC